MLNDLPQRTPVPFLPLPDALVLDDPRWAYRAEHGGPGGFARLRVWRGLAGGHLAVVTETGEGRSVTNAAMEIRSRLAGELGEPLALAELWPAGEGADDSLHLDLVQVPGPHARVGWHRIYPILPSDPLYDLLCAWWSVCGEVILAL